MWLTRGGYYLITWYVCGTEASQTAFCDLKFGYLLNLWS